MIQEKKIRRQFTIHSFRSAIEYNWKADFSFAGESHDFCEIVYVMSGAVDVTEDAQIYRLTKGNMLLHVPMEFHKIQSADGTSPHVLILSFQNSGNLPPRLSEGVFFLSEQEQEEYSALFQRVRAIYTEEDNNPYTAQECADRLSAFLIRLDRNHSAKEQLSYSRDALVYRNLIDVMTKNLYDNLTLEQLAGQLPISISYMKVLFRRYAGIGPKTYYSRLRCAEAIRLLQSGLSASETADRMNFSSPSYFNVFFRNMTGMPPASYIRREADHR